MTVRKSASAKNNSVNSSYDKADAWLNLSVIDANGVSRKLPKGLALYLKDHLSAKMIKAASSKEVTFKLEGTITIPSGDVVDEDIEF